MYKLFLCLRYLRSRLIAYFAVLGVAVCVFMVLVSVSVMNGFLHKIEQAAKGLFGDIVIESAGLTGLGYYDEFTRQVARQVPEVEAASPFIITFGLLRVPATDYRQAVQIAGIRLPERAGVTDFEDGLHFQEGLSEPTFDPPVALLQDRLRAEAEHTERIRRSEMQQLKPGKAPSALRAKRLNRLETARLFQLQAAEILRQAADYQDRMRRLQARLDAARLQAGGQDSKTVDELLIELEKLTEQAAIQPPEYRIILGLGISGLSFRTEAGQTVRYIVPGHKVVLSLVPLGQRLSMTDISPNTATFTVVDDCRTDVSSIDSEIVYLPFETLQRLNNMSAEYDADDPKVQIAPARCGQIHIKVAPEHAQDKSLEAVCRKVEAAWQEFHRRRPQAAGGDVSVQTWRQRQAKIIAPIEQQRTLVAIMFGIISTVAVVLIFVIFYMIVMQKTRDIGVMKAIGASAGGVAGIFLAYGAAVGLIGSILGCVGGYFFVRNINPIRDAMERWFGFGGGFTKEFLLFEKLPNEVKPLTALIIMAGAVLAGVLGAVIPAVKAAKMQAVEALRYE
ncbi:MAG: FtsX-like permease family protein [Planctomycetota bacterium]|nr:FtsX-like permease family protein [Planctomycetota bacterium]